MIKGIIEKTLKSKGKSGILVSVWTLGNNAVENKNYLDLSTKIFLQVEER